MQVDHMAEHSQHPLASLTLVLITHNRPAFLRRALRYYSAFGCKVLVLDSSVESAAHMALDYPSVDYRHLPEYAYSGLYHKMRYGVLQVTTPFMAFAADDDFMVLEGVQQAVGFLHDHADYSMCHGYSMMYLAHAGYVGYYRRDKKVTEDYDSPLGQERVKAYLYEFIPPIYAISRTEVMHDWAREMPDDMTFEWMEITHVYYLLVRGKARILPIAYIIREWNYPYSEHGTDVRVALISRDPQSVAARQRYAQWLAPLKTEVAGLDPDQAVELALECFDLLGDNLEKKRSLDMNLIFESHWSDPFAEPERRFALTQYVEMPFYNKALFDLLTKIEFLLHAMPAGRVQLQQLEGIWTRQETLLEHHANDVPQTVVNRLWEAMDCNLFNRNVVMRLAEQLQVLDDPEAAQGIGQWLARLDAVASTDSRQILAKMPSGRLRHWLQARLPAPEQVQHIESYLEEHRGGPEIGIMLLDLDHDMNKLQITLDSLVEGHYKRFKIIVLTAGEPPVATTAQNTLHFVKVGKSMFVDKLNQIARQSTCDWLMLAEVGDQFTAAGLARAGLELLAAPQCRAVAADEIHRQANGALTSVFRPGFNLDLLQSVPALMAHHWLIRRDVLIEAGGYSSAATQALEFDLLLRIIETGGLGWLAHLDEPLLICAAAKMEENAHERQTLIRHLGTRGYQALVSSEAPGTYRIEYRHSARPLVSVLLPCQDNLDQVQANLQSLRLRTRYINYEVLLIDNASQDPAMEQWLETAEAGWNKVRVLRSEQPSSLPALYNAAARQAKGEYLVLLDSDSQVVNPNWIESLLNHAQRPEVGIVGAKLVNADGQVTQAGLLLGFDGGVGAAFVGEPNDAPGYLQRLSVDQNYSAVSGACLMIGTALFQGVGGLDDDLFAESLSDVDLCLKVGQAGYMTVWTPYVQVIHPGEIVQTPTALAALRGKWEGVFAHDLAYNRNLSQRGSSFALGEEAPINWTPLLG